MIVLSYYPFFIAIKIVTIFPQMLKDFIDFSSWMLHHSIIQSITKTGDDAF